MMQFFQNIVVKKGIRFRAMTYNIFNSFGDTAKKAAIKKHIIRVDADFVSFQETNTTDFTYIQSEYTNEGYNYFRQSTDTGIKTILMSKYNIVSSEEIPLDGRNVLYCEIDVEGKKIGIATVHYPAWCLTSCNTSPDQLQQEPKAHDRMVHLYQTLNFLNNKKANDPTLKGFILQGDFNDDINNLQVDFYNSAPTGGVSLPNYLSYPLANAQFPLKPLEYYNGTMYLNLPTDLNEGNDTIFLEANPALTYSLRLDYIAYSDSIVLIGQEILNSKVDANTGLPKFGNPLLEGDGITASDHKPVFGDFRII